MKKILSLALVLMFVLAMVPAAFAAEAEIPAEVSNGTLVWDMEALPASFDGNVTDLFAEIWGNTGCGYQVGNITLASAAGKGASGSAALKWTANNTWGNTAYVNLAGQNGAVTDWTGATKLYFYMDTTEVGADMAVDVFLKAPDSFNGGMMKPGTTWQYFKDGAWVDATINEWGHMIVPANFAGWACLSIADLGAVDLSNVTRIGFFTDDSIASTTVYFDHFVTDVPNPNAGSGGGEVEEPPATGDYGVITAVALACLAMTCTVVLVQKKKMF